MSAGLSLSLLFHGFSEAVLRILGGLGLGFHAKTSLLISRYLSDPLSQKLRGGDGLRRTLFLRVHTECFGAMGQGGHQSMQRLCRVAISPKP